MPAKNKVKRSPVKTNVRNNETDNKTDPSAIGSEEKAEQFQLELYWCIQQLQNGLASGKLNKKQVQDHTKALNTLLNSHAPLIQKRQVMRLSFGDYREKMAAEEKKYKGIMNAKILPTKPNTKSTFVRKSALHTSNKEFRFNFDIPSVISTESNSQSDSLRSIPEKDDVNMQETPDADGDRQTSDIFKFVPSDNSFKFSFDVDV